MNGHHCSVASNDQLLRQFDPTTELWSPMRQAKATPREVLANKIVLLYFSASWCGPCQRFTPILKQLYMSLKQQERAAAEDFEVVYCSMDHTMQQYTHYASTMPWWCLEHGSPMRGKLAQLYGATTGIPHLVILDTDGCMLVPDAVGQATADPAGHDFPWRPKSLVQLLPNYYLQHANPNLPPTPGGVVRRPMSELDNKYLLLYFSAQWCPPCLHFTPKLCEAINRLKQHRDDFECLYVSSDHDEYSFNQYFATMPFAAMPFEERKAKGDIASRLEIRGIPSLVIFGPRDPNDPAGERPLINKSVREILEYGTRDYISDFPYHPESYGDLNKATENINTMRCVVVFHEGGDDEEQEDIQEALKLASETYNKFCSTTDAGPLKFFWANNPTGLSRTIRDALSLGPVTNEPVMILLDVGNQGSFYVAKPDADIYMNSILAFVQNPGERRHL